MSLQPQDYNINDLIYIFRGQYITLKAAIPKHHWASTLVKKRISRVRIDYIIAQIKNMMEKVRI